MRVPRTEGFNRGSLLRRRVTTLDDGSTRGNAGHPEVKGQKIQGKVERHVYAMLDRIKSCFNKLKNAPLLAN